MNTVEVLGKLSVVIRAGFTLKIFYNKDQHPKWTAELENPNRCYTHSDYGPIRALEGLVKQIYPERKKNNVLHMRSVPGGRRQERNPFTR